MTVRILSVPRCGTRFVRALLDEYEIDYIRAHFWGDNYHEPIIYKSDLPAIIPIRYLWKVEESWQNYVHLADYKLPVQACWTQMSKYMQKRERLVFPLHVDDPTKRHNELDDIGEMLGIEFGHVDFSNRVGEGKP